jgi:GNAT superfamily N-acetyltransferase
MKLLPADIVLRPASDAEMRACRLLLPAAFSADSAPEAMVAIHTGAPEQVVGACGLSWCNAPKPEAEPSGFAILLHVVPAMRRRGIGRALVEAAAAWCRDETTGLRSWLPIEDGSPAALFLSQAGFVLHHRTLHFETDLAGFHVIMDGVRARLQRSGRLPAEARICPLREAAAWDVAALVAPEFAAPHATILRRLSATAPDAFDLQRSVALYFGEALAGVLIFSWNGGDVGIEVIVVAPAFRGGAANVLLLEAATRAAIVGGAKRFRFFCDERTRDTLGLARRAGAAPTRVEAEYRRALT